MGLVDVVVTFKMTERVKLIITGAPLNDLPGEVTRPLTKEIFRFFRRTFSMKLARLMSFVPSITYFRMPVRHRWPISGDEGTIVGRPLGA